MCALSQNWWGHYACCHGLWFVAIECRLSSHSGHCLFNSGSEIPRPEHLGLPLASMSDEERADVLVEEFEPIINLTHQDGTHFTLQQIRDYVDKVDQARKSASVPTPTPAQPLPSDSKCRWCKRCRRGYRVPFPDWACYASLHPHKAEAQEA